MSAIQSPVQQGPSAPPAPVPTPPAQVPPPDAPGWPFPPASPDQGLPPTPPPGVPFPPPSHRPMPSPKPPAEPPPGEDPGTDRGSLTPWLVGAGVLGAGIAGAAAIRSGARNVRALRATAAAFDSGAMHQGGLQSIRDAQLGARFTAGIGTRHYLAVALPGVNRIGAGGRMVAVARGQLGHAELLSASAALRRDVGHGVHVHEPLRRVVLDGLEQGRSLRSVLDDLDRSAAGARPAFDNPQLVRYWDRTSIVERGPRAAGHEVMSGVSANRPELALEPVHVTGSGSARMRIVETGRQARINQLVAGRGADLDGRGLAEGIGTIQGVNVSTLNPAMRARAIEASGVDPRLVDAIGLNGAFTQRWRDRLAAGAPR